MIITDDSLVNVRGATMCFTGRRPKDLCGYIRASYVPFVEGLKELLELCYQLGIRNYITGGAQGFDQLVFWAVHSLKAKHQDIYNIVYIPFKEQPSAWIKPTGLFSPDEYKKMLSLADNYRVIATVNTNNKWEINDAYAKRNHAMCDDSTCIMSLYPDDSFLRASGGTAECMQYAYAHRLPMTRIEYYINNGILTGTFVTPVTIQRPLR